MSENLIAKLRGYIEFNENEERFIEKVFRVKHFGKGEHFLLAGDVCREAAFIENSKWNSSLVSQTIPSWNRCSSE
jgi:hypothetical protein